MSITPRRGTAIVSGVKSDAHTWNLVFLQLVLEEFGYRVVNLGPCVPAQMLVDACGALAPDLVVISSVNGHGYQDGLELIREVRTHAALAAPPFVIGGKLGVTDQETSGQLAALVDAGFDAVFDERSGVMELREFVMALPPATEPLGITT